MVLPFTTNIQLSVANRDRRTGCVVPYVPLRRHPRYLDSGGPTRFALGLVFSAYRKFSELTCVGTISHIHPCQNLLVNITKPSGIGYGYEEVVKLSSMKSILSKSLRTSTSIWAGGSFLYQEIWPDWLRSFECALASTSSDSHYKTSQILSVTKKIDHRLFSLLPREHMSTILPALHDDPAAAPNLSDHTICLWDGGFGIPCGAYISVSDLSKHLWMHGVNGPAKSVITCAWGGCGRAPMKRESVVRHVEEVHLQVKYLCDQCSASFSRRSTRNGHVVKSHPHA